MQHSWCYLIQTWLGRAHASAAKPAAVPNSISSTSNASQEPCLGPERVSPPEASSSPLHWLQGRQKQGLTEPAPAQDEFGSMGTVHAAPMPLSAEGKC